MSLLHRMGPIACLATRQAEGLYPWSRRTPQGLDQSPTDFNKYFSPLFLHFISKADVSDMPFDLKSDVGDVQTREIMDRWQMTDDRWQMTCNGYVTHDSYDNSHTCHMTLATDTWHFLPYTTCTNSGPYTTCRSSGPTPVAPSGSGAEDPPLAAHPVAGHFLQKSH